MKILSKYKDYYDYLKGIYGEDPKLILDRRNYNIPTFYRDQKFRLYIGGYIIEGLFIEGKFIYGKNLNKYRTKKISRFQSLHDITGVEQYNHVYISNDSFFSSTRGIYVCTEVMKDPYFLNQKLNCPIVLLISVEGLNIKRDIEYANNSIYCYNYPRLSNLELPSFISAEKIYNMLSSWLSAEITRKEQSLDNRTDEQKISTKGFDPKTSFRPKMKKK